MTDAAFDWGSLETHVSKDGTFAPPTRTARGPDAKVVKFPCTPCGGTGQFRGRRVHQTKSRCFACNGKGYFLTSERDRQQARQTAATRKATKLQDVRDVFDAHNPGVATFLVDAAKWSPFAAELTAKLTQYGALTDGQLRAVRSMQTKYAERQAARNAERAQGAAVVDLAAIRTMFETAVGNGYKRPVYRAAGLVISRAPDHGRNPGALYIKSIDTDDYLGKIIGINYTGKPAPALAAIARDPKGEAIRYGQRTGSCSCCGRELTVKASVDAGIGPICAEKWGLR